MDYNTEDFSDADLDASLASPLEKWLQENMTQAQVEYGDSIVSAIKEVVEYV